MVWQRGKVIGLCLLARKLKLGGLEGHLPLNLWVRHLWTKIPIHWSEINQNYWTAGKSMVRERGVYWFDKRTLTLNKKGVSNNWNLLLFSIKIAQIDWKSMEKLATNSIQLGNSTRNDRKSGELKGNGKGEKYFQKQLRTTKMHKKIIFVNL